MKRRSIATGMAGFINPRAFAPDADRVGGFEPGTLSVAEADAFIKTEHRRWGEVIRAAAIEPQ